MFPNTSYYVNLENGALLSDTALSWKMILRASEVIESHRKVMGEIFKEKGENHGVEFNAPLNTYYVDGGGRWYPQEPIYTMRF